MLTSSHPGAAAVMLCCVADQDLADGRIELRCNPVGDGVSPHRPRGPPGSVVGRAAGEDHEGTAVPRLTG